MTAVVYVLVVFVVVAVVVVNVADGVAFVDVVHTAAAHHYESEVRTIRSSQSLLLKWVLMFAQFSPCIQVCREAAGL